MIQFNPEELARIPEKQLDKAIKILILSIAEELQPGSCPELGEPDQAMNET